MMVGKGSGKQLAKSSLVNDCHHVNTRLARGTSTLQLCFLDFTTHATPLVRSMPTQVSLLALLKAFLEPAHEIAYIQAH